MILELLTKRYPGMRAWLMQRLTALVMAVYSLMMLVRIFNLKPSGYEQWLDFFHPYWLRLASLLFWISLSIHAWLGVRDVLKDYVPNVAVRIVLLRLVIILLWIYMAWAAYLLFWL